MPFHRPPLKWICCNALAIALALVCVASGAGAHGPVPPSLLGLAPPEGSSPAIPEGDRPVEGGRPVGEVVILTTADDRQVTWCYVADPEGNIIELQSWRPNS